MVLVSYEEGLSPAQMSLALMEESFVILEEVAMYIDSSPFGALCSHIAFLGPDQQAP